MIRPQIGSREQGNVMNVAMCDISGGNAQDFNKGDWTLSKGAPAPISREIFVNPQGGSGIYTTIQDAINQGVPGNNTGWVLINVAPGVYAENVTVPRDKPYVYLKGHQRSTTIVAGRSSGNLWEATLMVLADNFIAQRITFKNTFNVAGSILGNDVKPAVAVSAQGDKNSFYRCAFIGLQDTLFDAIGRHFFRSCYIEGAVDFIFGDGTSMYQACVINATGYGFITAQRRETPDGPSGFVLKFTRVIGTGPTYLGRAYGAYSRVLFYKSTLSGSVEPKGWDPWNFVGHENQLTYAEVGCRGDGANTSQRVSWEKTLSPSELKSLISTSFIDNEGWLANQPLSA
ncbi:putative pectinesterase 29 [Vitis vinifera]|uniref:Pectinesterase n=1 Tax=Vitis vinifera TaxID=29760 RepID=A0A438D1B1_VITVI|nr:putative pectinesterase 29 [Vitis vinifera]